MIQLQISNTKTLNLHHLVLDYNGTLAIEGIPIPGVIEKLKQVASFINIHIITADTFGVVRTYLTDDRFQITILSASPEDQQKLAFIESLDKQTVVAVGNGNNDALMLQEAALGIAVIQAEGASFKAISHADIVCQSIFDALEIVINPSRIKATIRN